MCAIVTPPSSPLLPLPRRWAEEQDLKDVRAILHGIRNGFNRRGEEAEEEVCVGEGALCSGLFWGGGREEGSMIIEEL